MVERMKRPDDTKNWPWPVDEAALVSCDIEGEKELVFFLPENQPDEEEVPAAIVFLAACACVWKSDNQKLIGEIIRYFEAGPDGSTALN
jgi:hypothetical protein